MAVRVGSGGLWRAVVAAALVLACGVLGGCAAANDPSAGGTGGDGSSQPSDATETFGTPETEATTPDGSEDSGGNDSPAISVARLPIGGDSQDDGDDPRLQCAHVTWIASKNGQIPSGTGVEITGVEFDPEAFRAVGDDCGSERPSCLHHVFRTQTLQCDLAVLATGEVAQDSDPSLGLTGLVYCPDNGSETCRRFVAALGDEQQLSVSLNVPQLPDTGETTTDPPTDPTTSATSTDGG